MSVIKAIQRFCEEYEKSQNCKHIFKPISYALWITWKWADKNEKPRDSEVEEW